MPLASSSSPLRWLLPVGALALGAMVLVPAAPESDRASVALISPAEAAINARLAPAPVETAVALAPVRAAIADDRPAPKDDKVERLVALASPTLTPKATNPEPPSTATLKVDEPAAVVVPVVDTPRLMARTGLNLRSAPSTNAPRLDVLKPRQQVAVVEVSGSWTRIRTDDGTEGWAYSPLLADPSAPITVASAPRTETVATVSRGKVTYEPTRRRTTLFDYLDDEGLISR